MDPLEEFEQLKRQNVSALGTDEEALRLSSEWLKRVSRHRYTYHFSWLGVPIIQIPQDIVAMQEIIWRVRPDLIIETGIAHGGSIVFYASMMELLGGDGHVLGIDIDIRACIIGACSKTIPCAGGTRWSRHHRTVSRRSPRCGGLPPAKRPCWFASTRTTRKITY